MGNQPTQNNFIKQQWQLVQKNITHAVWRNRTHPTIHIEQHDKFSTDQYTYHNDKQIFHFRHNNPYLVAGVFLQQNEEHEFCSTNYKYRMFIEKIPIRLTDIEHIPFPDILHLYVQCLNGFELLAQKLGYFFEVEQSYIGINELGVVKVWLSKYLANSTSIGGKISQQQMVKGVIDIVDKNSDPYQIGQSIPTIRNYLYRNADALKYVEAKKQLYSYIDTYNRGIVSNRLDCVEQAGGVYAIANRPQIQSQQSGVGQHELIPSSRINYDDPNRPQLVSNTNLSQPDYNLHNQYQNIDYMPLKPLNSIPNQINLKGSEVIPQAHRQQAIVNPTQVRQNMEVVRRRKSDYDKQILQFSTQAQPNNMKFSQTMPQQLPIQSRQLNLSRNVPVNQQTQSNIQFSFGAASQNIVSPQSIRVDNTNQTRNTNFNLADSSHQITFKQLNQNAKLPPLNFSGNPSPHISGNPSLSSFNPSPSLINSLRANNSSNVYIPDHTRTISQNSVPGSFVSHQASFNNSRKEIPNKNNYVATNVQSNSIVNNSNTNYIYSDTSKQLLQQKKKQVSFTPYLQDHNTKLLASFNPSYAGFLTKPQTTFKKSIQINPDDGKSSEDFLRQLRQINSSFGTTQNQRSKTTIPVQTSPISYSNSYNHNKLHESGNVRSYEQIATKTPVESIIQVNDQQFGRNTVSNIIENTQNSYKNVNPFTNNQPLKFQQGLTMKYSRLQADEPQQYQFRKPSFGSAYQATIDKDLLADLRKLKK